MRSARHVISALAATTLLATAVSTASATRLSISNQRIRTIWSNLEFTLLEGMTIRCIMTIEGSFHARTLAKVARALIGAITRARALQERCTSGTIAPFNGLERYNGTTSPNTLPWHLTYESFSGTLPDMTSIRLLLSRFRFGIRDSSGICAGQYGTAEDNVTLSASREAGGAITELAPLEGSNAVTLFRRDGGILCTSPARLGGRAGMAVLEGFSRITVTLI